MLAGAEALEKGNGEGLGSLTDSSFNGGFRRPLQLGFIL